jgi:hypothetical protein
MSGTHDLTRMEPPITTAIKLVPQGGYGWLLSSQAYLPEDTFDQEVASLSFERKHIVQTFSNFFTQNLP